MARPVAAIIPTRNSRAFLDRCLTSLVDQVYPALTITVVDNASTDGTTEDIETRWPGVRVLRSARNLGYARAVNLGAAQARGDVLALNVDTEFAVGTLDAMVRGMGENPSAGIIAPRVVEPAGRVQPTAHRFPTLGTLLGEALLLDRLPGCGGLGYRRTMSDEVAEWYTGVALLVRREAWEALGGFDPAYFFFVEELDLQERAARLGWQVRLAPAATVVHWGGSRPIPPRRFLHAHDGYERYFAVRRGRAGGAAARATLCLTALTRALAWLPQILLPNRSRLARSWCRMFLAVAVLSARRLPGATVRDHRPLQPGRPA
jgi:N-acetylglucosaminyl-diphospho-decaprenol L-rhamnosyltransferase